MLTDFTHIDIQRVKDAFIERMRKRYGKGVDARQVGISQGDWRAFRVWVEYSAADKETEQEFWRRFIGADRKKLAQALNFIYPGGYSWSEDPRQTIQELFPVDEAKHLIDSLGEAKNKPGIRPISEANAKRLRELIAAEQEKKTG